MRAALPHVHDAEKRAGSVARGMIKRAKATRGSGESRTLFTFREGNKTLTEAIAASLGCALRCGTKATAVQRAANGAGYEVHLNEGGARKTRAVEQLVLATPTSASAQLLAGIDSRFSLPLERITHAPVAVVSTGYRKSAVGNDLDGFGFLVPRSAGLEILGCVWNSSLFPGRAPSDQVLLTSFVGGTTNPQAINRSETELVDIVHRELSSVLAINEAPTFASAGIHPHAIPQYELGHTKRLGELDDLRRQCPGLWLAGNYFSGPSVGACIENAFGVAGEIAKSISS